MGIYFKFISPLTAKQLQGTSILGCSKRLITIVEFLKQFITQLLLSVAPLVKYISSGSAFIAFATCFLAFSIAFLDLEPKEYRELELP